MHAFIASQRGWLVVERLPAYAPELNPVEGVWSNLNGQEFATTPPTPWTTSPAQLGVASPASAADHGCCSPS
jgi:transposase